MLFDWYEKLKNAQKAALIDTGMKVQLAEIHVKNMAPIDQDNSEFRSAAREILNIPLLSPWSNWPKSHWGHIGQSSSTARICVGSDIDDDTEEIKSWGEQIIIGWVWNWAHDLATSVIGR